MSVIWKVFFVASVVVVVGVVASQTLSLIKACFTSDCLHFRRSDCRAPFIKPWEKKQSKSVRD